MGALPTGLVLLESGHAYRTTHLQHHKVFPSADDPEGYPAKISLLGAVLYGPVFLARLWFWAFQRNAKRPTQRVWLLVEALMPPLAIVGGVLLWSATPALLVYAALAIVGSWVYPLLTVHLPHGTMATRRSARRTPCAGRSSRRSSWS